MSDHSFAIEVLVPSVIHLVAQKDGQSDLEVLGKQMVYSFWGAPGIRVSN